MKKIKIKRGSGKYESERTKADVANGLAVHEGIGAARGRYVVTHNKSGHAIPWCCDTMEKAVAARDEISPLMNWESATLKDVVAGKKHIMKPIKKAFQSRGGVSIEELEILRRSQYGGAV
mgnify:CR=1 FL=1